MTLDATPQPPASPRTGGPGHGAAIVAVAALVFAAIAPTLSWPHLSGDSEARLAQTVLEMRHGGPWWVPTLAGQPRVRKPPLAAWISAAAVRPQTVSQLSSSNISQRESAYQDLQLQMRWPALQAACFMLLAVGWMGQIMGGRSYGLVSAAICGTTLLFLRFGRSATTDVHLALWVSVANACFAAAILRGRRWTGWCGGGLALGLALMSKGPVSLVQTIVPVIVFLIVMRLSAGKPSGAAPAQPRRWLWPIVAGVILMLAIALPWPLSTLMGNPECVKAWAMELRAEADHNISHDPWFAYWTILPNMLPWTPLFVAGIYLVCRDRRRQRPLVLALIMLAAPIVILSFFRDRKERYLLPLAGPAAILAAHAAIEIFRAAKSTAAERFVSALHWAVILAIAIGLPVAGGMWLTRPDGQPWYPRGMMYGAIEAGAAVIALGLLFQRRWKPSFVAAAAILMLMLNALFMWGWSRSSEGIAEMKCVADGIHGMHPAGQVVYYDPPPSLKPVTSDLDIYLDRTVPVVTQLPTGPARDAIGAMVVLGGPGPAEPSFPGWCKLFDIVSRKHHWYVLAPTAR